MAAIEACRVRNDGWLKGIKQGLAMLLLRHSDISGNQALSTVEKRVPYSQVPHRGPFP